MFCTNCGKKTSSKKICENCNVKIGSAHSFCKWCGAELEENAKNCPQCKEKVKNDLLVLKILFYVVGVLFVIVGIVSISNGDYLPGVFFGLFGILLLPIVKDFIKKTTCCNPKLHNLIMKIRIVALVVLVIAGIATIPPSDPDTAKNSGSSNSAAEVSKEPVILNEQQALKAAKEYMKDNSRKVEKQIASECEFTKFYSPEFVTYSTKMSGVGSWTITVKGNMAGYIDEYGSDFEKYNFDMKIYVSEDGSVRLGYVNIS